MQCLLSEVGLKESAHEHPVGGSVTEHLPPGAQRQHPPFLLAPPVHLDVLHLLRVQLQKRCCASPAESPADGPEIDFFDFLLHVNSFQFG